MGCRLGSLEERINRKVLSKPLSQGWVHLDQTDRQSKYDFSSRWRGKALMWEGQSREQPERSSICMRKLKHRDLARVTQHVTPQNQGYNTGLNDAQASAFPHRAFWRSGSCRSLCPARLISFLPILMDICLWTRLAHTISSMKPFLTASRYNHMSLPLCGLCSCYNHRH